jgi:hypothetical protein
MNRKTLAGDRRRRKLITFLWALALTIVTIVLIYWEKTAVLYILATLGVCGLLLIVAFSDLAHLDAGTSSTVQSNDASGVAKRVS